MMAIHVHAQEWLTLISKISRSTLAQRQKTSKHSTTDNNDNLKERSLMTHDTDPTGEGIRGVEQAEEAGIGGGDGSGGSGLQRSRGLRPPHGRAHSIARLETVL